MQPDKLHTPAVPEDTGTLQYHLYHLWMNRPFEDVTAILDKHQLHYAPNYGPFSQPYSIIVEEAGIYAHPVFEDLKACKSVYDLMFSRRVHPLEVKWLKNPAHEEVVVG